MLRFLSIRTKCVSHYFYVLHTNAHIHAHTHKVLQKATHVRINYVFGFIIWVEGGEGLVRGWAVGWLTLRVAAAHC